MEYNYKKLSAVDILEETTDATTVVVEEDGEIKRIPKSKLAPELPTDLVRTEQLEEAFIAVEEKIPEPFTFTASTEDITAGTTELATNTFYFVYE